PDLLGLPRKADRPPIAGGTAGNVERRVPERIPLVLLDHLVCDVLDAVLLESLLGLALHAAAPGDHAELRRHAAGQRSPRAPLLPRSELRDGGRPVVDDEPEPQLLVPVTVPGHDQR